jgi:WD repeat-containing protein 23
MSSSQAPTSPPNEGGEPRTIVYDPSDPFWRDTDDDDDDMDYQPAEGGSEEDEDGEGDLSFHGKDQSFDCQLHVKSNSSIDAAERLNAGDLSGVEIAFEYTDDNDEDENDDDDNDDEDDEDDDEEEEDEEEGDEGTAADGAPRPVYITREQIMQLLGHAGLGRIFASDLTPRTARRRNLRTVPEDGADDGEDNDPGTGYDSIRPERSQRYRGPRGRAAFEKVPSDQGRELMNAGAFGSSPRSEDTIKRKKRLAYNIMRRSLGLGSEGRQKNANRLLRQDMIPESVADTIIHYNARCYSGQFSDDGNFFFSCAQDFRVRMYDTSNPYDWKYYKVRHASLLYEILD